MARKGERREYLSRDQMTPEFLSGLADETNMPHREILDYVRRVTHAANPQMPQGSIMRRVALIPKDQIANIVGFASRSIRVKRAQFRSTMVEPFHIKNSYMFNIKDPGYRLAQDDNPELDEASVVMGTAVLENGRLNLVVESFIVMMNEGAFLYYDGETLEDSEHVVAIDYSQDITELEDAGSHTGSSGDFSAPDTVNALYEFRKIKSQYRDAPGIDFTPNLFYVNDNTAGQLLLSPEIKNKYTPLQSSDPDRVPETYEGFSFDGVDVVTLHKSYQTEDGLMPPVADGYAIVLVREDPNTGLAPLEWHSAENKLNREDASQPRIDMLVTGDEHPEIGPRLYDNGIPAPSRRNIIRRVKLF